MIVVSHRFRVRQALLGTALAGGARGRSDAAGTSADAPRGVPVVVVTSSDRAQGFTAMTPVFSSRLEATPAGR
jgi:hypothetical protein